MKFLISALIGAVLAVSSVWGVAAEKPAPATAFSSLNAIPTHERLSSGDKLLLEIMATKDVARQLSEASGSNDGGATRMGCGWKDGAPQYKFAIYSSYMRTQGVLGEELVPMLMFEVPVEGDSEGQLALIYLDMMILGTDGKVTGGYVVNAASARGVVAIGLIEWMKRYRPELSTLLGFAQGESDCRALDSGSSKEPKPEQLPKGQQSI